jgi:nucleoside-diphosphate-sugar epimerase
VISLVTGATGFTGGHVARTLSADGERVRALVRPRSLAKPEVAELRHAGVDIVPGDLVNAAAVRAAAEGCGVVYHIAATYREAGQPDSAYRAINVEGTRHVLETMRELGIPKGVYTSTLAVFSDTGGRLVDESYRYDGPHISEYDRSKWAAHYQVADPLIQAGLPLVIVQPGLVYGPGDTSSARDAFIQYLQHKLPMAPQKTAFCWAHVDDIARGHILAMEKGKPGESYIIAGPPHTFIEALAQAERITGIPAPRLHPSPGLMKAMAAFMGAVEQVVPLPDMFTGEYLRVNAGVTYIGSNAKAKRELGYDPRPLADGLRDMLLHEMKLLGMTPKSP